MRTRWWLQWEDDWSLSPGGGVDVLSAAVDVMVSEGVHQVASPPTNCLDVFALTLAHLTVTTHRSSLVQRSPSGTCFRKQVRV